MQRIELHAKEVQSERPSWDGFWGLSWNEPSVLIQVLLARLREANPAGTLTRMHKATLAADPVLLDILLEQHSCKLPQVCWSNLLRCKCYLCQGSPKARLRRQGLQFSLSMLDNLRIRLLNLR